MRRVAAAALCLSLVGGACGGGAAATKKGRIAQLPASTLPTEALDLDVQYEKVNAVVADARRSYLEAVGLWSFRKNDLLQATVQISRFAKNANYKKRDFRQSILQQIGTTNPKAFTMGGRTVYLTSGKRQGVVIWFRGKYLFVLSAREEFAQSRALLRELMEVDL